MNKANQTPSTIPQPPSPFWRDVARGVITAVIVAVLLAIPFKLIAEKLVGILIARESTAPVGTIVASYLPPDVFLTPGLSNAWVLAEGQSIPRNSKLFDLVNKSPIDFFDPTRIPDLRGMFLRGMNAGRNDQRRDPDKRKLGAYQSDSFRLHDHGGGDHTHATAIQNGAASQWQGITVRKVGDDSKDNPEAKTTFSGKIMTPEGGNETRPKNVTVYYYIRIN